MSHLLEIDGVQFQLNGRMILSSVYVKCETGKITGLLGRNGEGKSCLMNIVYGTLPCKKSVRIDHKSIVRSFKRPDLLKYLPQFNFAPKSLSLQRAFQDFKLDFKEFQARFPEFIAKQKTSFGALSGGERRLAEVYLIIKANSQFAMLDEPFTHLNPLQIERVKELLEEEKLNKGFIITDHIYKHIIELCDNLYVLSNGRTHFVNNAVDVEALGYARI